MVVTRYYRFDFYYDDNPKSYIYCEFTRQKINVYKLLERQFNEP